jgi:hypothetical protein
MAMTRRTWFASIAAAIARKAPAVVRHAATTAPTVLRTYRHVQFGLGISTSRELIDNDRNYHLAAVAALRRRRDAERERFVRDVLDCF